jgi:hypothetical protein
MLKGARARHDWRWRYLYAYLLHRMKASGHSPRPATALPARDPWTPSGCHPLNEKNEKILLRLATILIRMKIA